MFVNKKLTRDSIKLCLYEIILMISFTLVCYLIVNTFNIKGALNGFIWLLKEILVYIVIIKLFNIKVGNLLKPKAKISTSLLMILFGIVYLILETVVMQLLTNVPNYSFYDYLSIQFGGKGMAGATLIIYLFILTVIIAPFLEEVVYRGYMLGNILKEYNNPIVPILISSMAFGLIHLSILGSLNGFLFGMVSGVVYYKWNNVRYNMILHRTINLITFLILIINLI
ncbi:CPBP family intramembrane glutamic endopeptidase [Clostridium perfringens]|uniref:CPBP family intramembrane glutamic endopeptidase n=1 Tax=Clostridium perfringens TaxID=1502 RepID=UPI0013A66EA0|nr:type II CAAX endopeptidase family protein [Clostridium perfringens]